MGDVGVKLLTNFFLPNGNILHCISTLDLSFNCLTSQSGTAIRSIIQEGKLVTLNLSYNDLGESGAAEISQALKVNSTLKTFFLTLNGIGVNGTKLLASALLCHNHTLEHLDIGFNKIMDDGIMAISECFKVGGGKNPKLTCIKSLNLAANCLTSHSKTAVSNIIQEGALTSLHLSYNKLGESGAYEISKALQVNLTLKRLFLSNNAIGVRGALSLAVALCHNQTLQKLYIEDNEILDDGAIAIAECLKTNTALKSLNMSHNNITEVGAVEMTESLKVNPVIETLKIDKKCIEIIKPDNKRLLYNETVSRWYYIEINSTSSHSARYCTDKNVE